MPVTMTRTPKISIPLPTTRIAWSTTGSSVLNAVISSIIAPFPRTSAAAQLLVCFHARRDRRDNARRHFELVIAVLDAVSPCDPVEIGIGGPDLALIVFEDEQPHRPVEPGIGVCRDELRAERRITKVQEH